MRNFTSLQLWKVLVLTLIILCAAPLHSTSNTKQSDALSALIAEAQYALDNGDPMSCISIAQDAYSLAEANANKSGMGTAMQMEAQALIALPKKQKSNRKKALAKLEASLLLLNTSSDRAVRIKSLSLLMDLSAQRGDEAKAQHYEKQIGLLQDAAATSENLNSALSYLSKQKRLLTEKDTLLSQAQLKTQLLVALQKNKVDSLKYHMEKDSISLLQTQIKYEEQSAKLDLQKSQKKYTMALLALVLLAGVGVFMRYRQTKKTNELLALKNEIIESERKKSDELLLNILPAVVAAELKAKGAAEARRYESATVFFSDFAGFTTISERMTPRDLVKLLDEYFRIFDSIITDYNLEKIKTIGDAYMCVGGISEDHHGHPVDVIDAAVEIQKQLAKKKAENEAAGLPFFEARIGIHTGSVVSGVVGNKKFAFDIWGDTVNVASRMEQHGSVGNVNISATTQALIAEHYACTSRGKLPVKNKGEIEMYYVDKRLN